MYDPSDPAGSEAQRPAAPPITPRMIVGLAFVVMGTVFLLDNFDIVDAGPIWRWWPAGIIAIGLAKLSTPRGTPGRASGLVFVLIGTWLLLHTLDVIPYSIFELWPAILVAIGLGMLARTMRPSATSSGPATSDQVLHGFAIMGGVTQKSNSSAFRGGDATAIMGGVEMDLRDAKMEGNEATLEVFALWGGIDIQVPPEWGVEVQGMPIMGAFEDTRKNVRPDAQQRLVLKGTVLMGGVEVKN